MNHLAPSTLITILVLLIMLSACFSASETAMMSLNRYKLMHLVRKKIPAASRCQDLLARPDRLLGIILLGNTLANIFASSIATLLALRYWGEMGLVLTTFALTFMLLIFAETAPKTLAALYPERVAFPLSWFLRALLKGLSPCIFLMNTLSNGFLRCFGIRVHAKDLDKLSAEEFKTLLLAHTLDNSKKQSMMAGILDLEQATVNDIMVPREAIMGLDIDQDWAQCLEELRQIQHGKILLYQADIDQTLGYISTQKLLSLALKKRFDLSQLKQQLEPIVFVPEGTHILKQLHEFQEKQYRLGLVVDEYSKVQGLITLADILEEIVGEYSDESLLSLNTIRPQSDGSIVLPGNTPLRDLNRQMQWDLPIDGPNTLSGLIIETLEHVPTKPVGCRLGNLACDILRIKHNRISLVKLYPQPDANEKTPS